MNGYTVEIAGDIYPLDAGLTTVPLKNGSRSLLFFFYQPADSGDAVRLGAVIDNIQGGHLDGPMVARLTFWADEAREVALPGATFDIWYGGKVGQGVVTGVVDSPS